MSKNWIIALIAALIASLVMGLTACSDDDDNDEQTDATPSPAVNSPTEAATEEAPAVTETEASEAARLTVDDIGDIEVPSDSIPAGSAQLNDGVFDDSEAMVHVELVDELSASGDLNGDGADDVAVIVATNAGGSGVFNDLAVVASENGTPVNVATAFLGDRVQVTSLAIEDGQVVLEMITQGPDDPHCCPTLEVVVTYELQGEELVEVSREEAPGA